MVWPHGEKAFYRFLDILNKHEPPIMFKDATNYYFFDKTIYIKIQYMKMDY